GRPRGRASRGGRGSRLHPGAAARGDGAARPGVADARRGAAPVTATPRELKLYFDYESPFARGPRPVGGRGTEANVLGRTYVARARERPLVLVRLAPRTPRGGNA